ncbi:hypothetical protein EON63_08410 [archaeon]|nr:MAG: hypothetical protein EON63_08410 [archaeon]
MFTFPYTLTDYYHTYTLYIYISVRTIIFMQMVRDLTATLPTKEEAKPLFQSPYTGAYHTQYIIVHTPYTIHHTSYHPPYLCLQARTTYCS